MTANGIAQILVFLAIIATLAVPFGNYMARVFAGEHTLLSPVLVPFEKILYRLSGIDEAREELTRLLPLLDRIVEQRAEAAELAAADRYEVGDYKRVAARFKSGKEAWVYIQAGVHSPRHGLAQPVEKLQAAAAGQHEVVVTFIERSRVATDDLVAGAIADRATTEESLRTGISN